MMVNFAVCIFLSAFLLFQIQPIISKTLLPWFGGTPAVWSATMLFFQILLTGGYAYSNWLIRSRNARRNTIVHLALMGISVALVIFLWVIWPSPITPDASWKPDQVTNPVLTIFLLLSISVGLPFFVLSTNSPLMQAWFSQKNPGRSPYWLYALSNIGSLLGLLAYPILVEPSFTIPMQGWLWAGGYFIFVLLVGYNALLTLQLRSAAAMPDDHLISPEGQKLRGSTQGLWILLSACASLMVLAVTNQITQEVAVIPFLWVLPLSIYLLTFVFAFSSMRLYHRGIYSVLLALGTAGLFYIIFVPSSFIVQIIVYNFLLFATAMICHGELYALRPQAAYLTRFYLMVSIGGALGGFFVNLVAPYIFRGYWELYIGFALTWVILAALSYSRSGTRRGFWYSASVGAVATIVTVFMGYFIFTSSMGYLYVNRNFYGVTRVRQIEIAKNNKQAYQLVHGSTIHGFQFLEAGLRDTPTAYYSVDSGVGLAILNHPHDGSGMRIGVLGLGIGTLAAYGQSGDYYRFYEINPVIIDLANTRGNFFSFIRDSQATTDIVLGDARLSLEKELAAGENQDFDVLILDAFSSDSLPVHLITRQAFDIYLQHLAEDGLLAVNISNTYLDLRPVVWQLAQYYDLEIAIVTNPAENNPAAHASIWALLARNPKLLDAAAIASRSDRMDGYTTNVRLWTDDYSNLFQILR